MSTASEVVGVLVSDDGARGAAIVSPAAKTRPTGRAASAVGATTSIRNCSVSSP
jgi:hypothetical protein